MSFNPNISSVFSWNLHIVTYSCSLQRFTNIIIYIFIAFCGNIIKEVNLNNFCHIMLVTAATCLPLGNTWRWRWWRKGCVAVVTGVTRCFGWRIRSCRMINQTDRFDMHMITSVSGVQFETHRCLLHKNRLQSPAVAPQNPCINTSNIYGASEVIGQHNCSLTGWLWTHCSPQTS